MSQPRIQPKQRRQLALMAMSIATVAQCTLFGVAVNAQAPVRLQADAEIVGIGPNGENADRVPLHVMEEPTGRLVPLLPYLFFDDGSAVIPSRYTNADSGATGDPFVRSYRAILRIVGERMKVNPRERLVVTGTTSNADRDRRTAGLSRRRARAVAEYLVSAFGIDRARLDIRARSMPANASNNNYDAGRAENRRVEFSGSDVVLAPITLEDTLARVSSTGLRVLPSLSADASARLMSWQIELRHDGGLFRRLHGTTSMKTTFDETFTESELRRFAMSPTGIDLSMTIRVDNDSIVIPRRTVLFRVDRVRRAPGPSDGRSQDRESIVLFAFNSAELTPDSKRILLDLLERIPADAQLSVTGFTDETGDAARNLALSNERAGAVEAALAGRVAAAHGAGASGGHHWNSTPEDRFYSRVARISVRY